MKEERVRLSLYCKKESSSSANISSFRRDLQPQKRQTTHLGPYITPTPLPHLACHSMLSAQQGNIEQRGIKVKYRSF